MPVLEIYTKSWCQFCASAKDRLNAKGIPYVEIDVTTDRVKELEMIDRSGRLTVPQIFIDGLHLGGSDDLSVADANGNLDFLLFGEERGEAA